MDDARLNAGSIVKIVIDDVNFTITFCGTPLIDSQDNVVFPEIAKWTFGSLAELEGAVSIGDSMYNVQYITTEM